MSEYGFRTYDANGNILVDINSRLSRLRYSVEVAAGASGNVTLSDLTGLLTVEISVINKASPTLGESAHQVSRSNNTISWIPCDAADGTSVDSIIFVFIYGA
jgi:hypothetical protein